MKGAGALLHSSKSPNVPAQDRIGVLLMALGGPDSLDAVGHYLKELRGGRETPLELIDEAVLEELERSGHRQVLFAPIGFLSDHVEILYDIDVEFQKLATQKAMRLERIPMLNATPPLVETLADVVQSHLQETGPLPSA
jgi:protoheme ferro-lyase